MADLNLSLEIQGTTRTAIDELGRLKAAGDQVTSSFAKQADQMQAVGQAGSRAMGELTDRARGANEVLRQLVERGQSFSDASRAAQKFAGIAPTLTATDLGLQAQAARASQAAAAGPSDTSNLHISPAFAALMNARAKEDERRLNEARAQQQRQFTSLTREREGGGPSEGGVGASGLAGLLERGQGPIRFAAGLVGISLGLNVAASAAGKLHEEIAKSLEAERGLEVGARSIAAAYGQSVLPSFQAASRAFVTDPTTKGSQAEFLGAAAGMRELTTAYGLNDQQVQQLLQDAGQLARIHGTDLPTASKALQSVMQGNTSAAAVLGVALTDEMGRIRGVGASYEELVAISGRTRAEAVLFSAVHENIATQQKNAKGTSDDLAAAMDRLGRAADRNKAALGDALKGPATGTATAAATVLEGQGNFNAFDPSGGFATGRVAQMRKQQADAAAISSAIPAGLANEQLAGEILLRSAGATATTAFERWRIEITRTTESLQRLQGVQSQFATIAKAVEGVDFPGRLEPGQARGIGAARAADDFLAEQVQKIAIDRAQAMRQHLVGNLDTAQQVGTDATARAQIDLQYFEARAAAQAKSVEAQHEQVTAELALSMVRRQDLEHVQALANAQAEIVGHAQEQRDIAHDLNSIEDQRVQVARELTVLQARQNELPAGRRVQDLQREQQLLLAQAHLHPDQRADVAGRLRDITLHGLPEAQFADLQAQGPLIAAQRAQEDASLARDIRLSPTRLRQIDMEGVMRPVQDLAARLQEEQQLRELGATPEQIAVERARRNAEDAQRALYGIPSPSASATAAGVGATAQTFQITVYANGATQGGNGVFDQAAQKGGAAFAAAFNEALATTGTPPVRPMLGAADNLIEP